MNLHDILESGGRPPKKGTTVRINGNARQFRFRGRNARIGTYHVCLYLENGEEVTVTAKSVDVEDTAHSTTTP